MVVIVVVGHLFSILKIGLLGIFPIVPLYYHLLPSFCFGRWKIKRSSHFVLTVVASRVSCVNLTSCFRWTTFLIHSWPKKKCNENIIRYIPLFHIHSLLSAKEAQTAKYKFTRVFVCTHIFFGYVCTITSNTNVKRNMNVLHFGLSLSSANIFLGTSEQDSQPVDTIE